MFTIKVELVIRINQYELLEQFPTRITVIHCTPYLPMTCFSNMAKRFVFNIVRIAEPREFDKIAPKVHMSILTTAAPAV